MNLLKGLISVAFIYAIGWGVYLFGYSRGADTESSEAALRLTNCQQVVTHNGLHK